MSNCSEFTKETALTLLRLQSSQDYPIKFDDAWRWLEYSRKDAAKRFFMSAGFVEGIDYRLHNVVESAPQGGLTHREDILLSCECMKQWGMMAGTPKGKEIRLYFLECERRLKRILSGEASIEDLVQEYARIYKPEYQQEWWDELYRVTGYKRPKKGHNMALSHIIRHYVYEQFPEGTLAELERLNPVVYTAPRNTQEQIQKSLTVLRRKMWNAKSVANNYEKKGYGYATHRDKWRKRAAKLQKMIKNLEAGKVVQYHRREFRFHQFCSDIVGLPTLQNHLARMTTVMKTLPSNDIQAFYTAMDKAFEGGAELRVTSIILDVPFQSDWNKRKQLRQAKR